MACGIVIDTYQYLKTRQILSGIEAGMEKKYTLPGIKRPQTRFPPLFVRRRVVSGAAGKSLIVSLRTALRYFCVWRAVSVMSFSFLNADLISSFKSLSLAGLVRRRYIAACGKINESPWEEGDIQYRYSSRCRVRAGQHQVHSYTAYLLRRKAFLSPAI